MALAQYLFCNDPHLQQHSHIGKGRRVRQDINRDIAVAEQRGLTGDAASLRLGHRYFQKNDASDTTPFQMCGQHVRKLSRKDGDVFQRRYFCVGQRYGVTIYEPFNVQTNVVETHIHQRLIWHEQQPNFVSARVAHRRQLQGHAAYLHALEA